MLRKMYRKLIAWLDTRSTQLRIRKQDIAEHLEVRRMVNSAPVNGKELTKKQMKQTEVYWKEHYGKKIDTIWHRKYTGYSGKFDVCYFPEILYTTKLEPLLNPEQTVKVLQDKNLIHFLFARVLCADKGIVVPETICGCSNGNYFDEERSPIDQHQTKKIIMGYSGQCIIKPTVGESSGHGVKFLDMQEISNQEKEKLADTLLDQYGKNFIVQKRILQHEAYAKLHPESINTIRVMTYRKNGMIKSVPCIMRIGVGKTHLDNAHAGGVYIGVSENGVLQERALRNYCEWIYEHPDTHITFKDYSIPGVAQIVESAKLLHTCLPSVGFVNWDFSYDLNGNVVLIESNMSCCSIWLFQNTWGKSAFGDDTEYFANMIRRK